LPNLVFGTHRFKINPGEAVNTIIEETRKLVKKRKIDICIGEFSKSGIAIDVGITSVAQEAA
jgi:hypothetical protein